jgi:hypothetical protein
MNRTHHTMRARFAGLVALAAALAVPATAAALPSVFTTTAKVVPAGQTPEADWTQADLENDPRYLVTSNGFTYSLRESNGKLDGGILTFDRLPGAYRTLFETSRWLAEGATGAQPHATCDAASLTDEAVVLGWQGAEPSYAYIPFQATAAGLGDDPATWLGKVKSATGLTLTKDTDLAAACAGIGGTLIGADTVVEAAPAFAAGLTAPLEAKVAALETKVSGLEGKVKDLEAAATKADAAKAKADADIAKLKLEAAQFTLKVSSAATLARGLEVDVAGPPNRPVFVRVKVSEAQRRKLRIPYKTLGTGTGTTDAKGKIRVIVQPRANTAGVLLKQQTAVPVQVWGASGDRTAVLVVDLGG